MPLDEVKQISVQQLDQLLLSEEQDFILLDVREPWELQRAKLDDPRVNFIPLRSITGEAIRVLTEPGPDHPPIYVLCHHGLRSAAVVRWLQAHGWSNSFNILGGLEHFAARIDPTIGRY